MNIEYVLEKLDVVRVCLNDMSNTRQFNELIIENAVNHLFDAVIELKGIDS